MASFEPVIIVYGSGKRIASCQLRFPISFSLAFDAKMLDELVNFQPKLSDIQLKRYFLILLDPIETEYAVQLEENHRIISIYYPDRLYSRNQNQLNRMTNSYRQMSLDVTNDIIQFLTLEGQKQISYERTSLVSIYFKQARIYKEWAMTSFRAEPCHILLISLNSQQKNLHQLQQRLERTANQLGYPSVVIRQLNDYIPQTDRFLSILPYAKQLFEYEKPLDLVRLIQKLSPIRLYVYGNELSNLKEWNQLMIENETSVMNDEDNWCAFLQSEPLDDEVKWNFALVLGKTWKVNRVSPLNYEQFAEDPRFHSALYRAHRTFAERQIEVTAQIFDWYDDCLKENFLQVEPVFQNRPGAKRDRNSDSKELTNLFCFRNLSFFDYQRFDQVKNRSITFVWLDEILTDCPSNLHQAIEPFQWKFCATFQSVVSLIESELRLKNYIFLVCSGSLGQLFFTTPFTLKNQIHSAYVFCAQLQPNMNWSQDFSNIRGVFNDSIALAERIRVDLENIRSRWLKTSTQDNEETSNETVCPLPLTIYHIDEVQQFLGHQRTIDNLLCMPHDLRSKWDMINEFRRIFSENPVVWAQIDVFEETYKSVAAVQWYTRDSFIWRTLNQALRTSDVTTMFRFRHILTDIYSHLDQSYQQRRYSVDPYRTEMYYRGQIMLNEEFERFQDLRGSLISINTFLSTTTSMQIALLYAGKYFESNDIVPIVFNIEATFNDYSRPYASISPFSLFPDEDETLFAMGSVFRVGNIRLLPNSDNIWLIHLKMVTRLEYDQ